ncbi:MAG: MFS transporter [Chloroflexi bacterium]|nr:MFS transporter [Chloroflexota bacterium]
MEKAQPTPRRAPLFYGWVIVAVMATVGALCMALGSLNFGLFVKPMGDELGIGRSVFGWAQSARQVASAVTAPVVGGLIDRFGSRVLLTTAAVITGGAVFCLAFVSEGWQLVVLFALMGVVGMNGPGALVTSVPVTKWFVRNRGKAFSFMSLGIPVGGLIFVPLSQVFIDTVGWRNAWILLAVVGAGLIVPLSLIFVRRQPEDLGLLPDGGPPTPKPTVGTGHAGQMPAPPVSYEEHSWTRTEALHSATFWRLVFVFSVVGLATSSVALHRIPSFMDRGLDPRLVSYATALDAAAAGLSTFAMGLMTQRIPARFIGAGGFVMLTLASALTIVADNYAIMFLSMITFGLGIGTLMLTQNYLWADYFGRRHLGSIRGAVMPATLLFGGAGAPLAGYIRDFTGSYTLTWLAATVLMALGAVVMALTPPPRPMPGTPPLAVRAAPVGGPS